jgi:hypothetical protein
MARITHYVGIYQIACVLALRMYGISDAAAIAYSIMLQITIFTVIGIQGVLAALSYGIHPFSFRRIE